MGEKDKAGILLGKCELAWSQFNQRRGYEWKLSFGIWTAIALFIATLLRNDTLAFGCPAKVLLTILAILILAIHGIFLLGIKLGNDVDRRIAYFYEQHIHSMYILEFDEKVNDAKCKLKRFDTSLITLVRNLSRWLPKRIKCRLVKKT